MSDSEIDNLCRAAEVERSALIGYVECAPVSELPRWIEWVMNLIDIGSGTMPATRVSTTSVVPKMILVATETRVFEFRRSRWRKRWYLLESYPTSSACFEFLEDNVDPPSKIRAHGKEFYVDSGSLDVAKRLAQYSWPDDSLR